MGTTVFPLLAFFNCSLWLGQANGTVRGRVKSLSGPLVHPCQVLRDHVTITARGFVPTDDRGK